MAISFPTGLDNFTNPSSGNTLDSPSHSLQHSDLNDAVEALETKLGVGASPAGSATAGYVLTAGTGGTTTWQALSSKISQVIQGSTTTSTTIATTSFTDTTLTASITPSATSSQVLIIFAQPFSYTRTASENGVGIQLLRGSTSIYDISGGGGYTNRLQISGMTYFNFNDVVTGVYLDSPSSTSALTYKTQAKIESAANAGSSAFNISRATITLMEIKA